MKQLRIKQIEFMDVYDTDLIERMIRIRLHRAGFDFGKEIKRWTDYETLEEVFEQKGEEVQNDKSGRFTRFIKSIFKTS